MLEWFLGQEPSRRLPTEEKTADGAPVRRRHPL